MGLLREQYAEFKKGHLPYCRNQVWMKNGWRIPWNVTSVCETFKISAKDLSRLHQFGLKVLPGIFLEYALYAGRIWKGDILVADIEEIGADGRIGNLLKKTQCKRSVNAHEW